LRIVIDTNVFIAAIIRQWLVRETLLAYPGSFMTPEFCIVEANGKTVIPAHSASIPWQPSNNPACIT